MELAHGSPSSCVGCCSRSAFVPASARHGTIAYRDHCPTVRVELRAFLHPDSP
ncbi:hypothetical protein HMPREF1317_0571 [Schaalia georgiae F0490]|uniref:Uncharacterized protein n=1 Tax=Schaalia georgiae F0490 TaxID=1125717 RepID=J0WZA1_9ACTO|nr:hypothetical protein HMPREF1317_0571 [Schaalia georgiae F0490]